MRETLTFAEAAELLKEVVAERGRNYVNEKVDNPAMGLNGSETCVYFLEDGTPSCGVGAVLAKKGLKMLDLDPYDNMVGAFTLFRVLHEQGIMEIDQDARTLLTRFQHVQDADEHNTWGEALDSAFAVFSE